MENQTVIFEQKHIRRLEHEGETWFSVVDIIEILTDSVKPRDYWSVLKKRESQLPTICRQLKLQSSDGKFYKTDCTNSEGVFRIIQSVPSPKAEPFKMWLASLGKQAIDETADPELGFDRLRDLYKLQGRSEEWIKNRLQTISTRKELTDEWQKRGIQEGREYSILTAVIAKGTFGVTPNEHGKLKGLARQNLRDHMTPLELIFTALGEEATRSVAVRDDAQGFTENHDAAQRGGGMAGDARERFEEKFGESVVSPTNFLTLKSGDDEAKPSNELLMLRKGKTDDAD